MYARRHGDAKSVVDTGIIRLPAFDELQIVSEAESAIFVMVKSGSAEIRGEPLIASEWYVILADSATTVLSTSNCELAVAGWPQHARVLHCPNYKRYLLTVNLCERLNAHREEAARRGERGPVVLVVGGQGKTFVSKCLLKYSYRSGWGPVLVSLERSGASEEVEFVYSGRGVITAHLPDVVDAGTAEICSRLESMGPAERLNVLSKECGNENAAVDSEHMRVRAVSLLNSLARREAVNDPSPLQAARRSQRAQRGQPASRGGDETASEAVPGASTPPSQATVEAFTLNSWETVFRPLPASGDISVLCSCPFPPPTAHDSGVPPPPAALGGAAAATESLSLPAPDEEERQSCGCTKRLLECVQRWQRTIGGAAGDRLAAAGVIIDFSGDMSLDAVLADAHVDCVVLCGDEALEQETVLLSKIARFNPLLPITRLPKANVSYPSQHRSHDAAFFASRLNSIFKPATGSHLYFPRLVHGKVVEYIKDHPLPLKGISDPLPARLLLVPLAIPRYEVCTIERTAARWVDAESKELSVLPSAQTIFGCIPYTGTSTVATPCVVQTPFEDSADVSIWVRSTNLLTQQMGVVTVVLLL